MWAHEGMSTCKRASVCNKICEKELKHEKGSVCVRDRERVLESQSESERLRRVIRKST